MAKIDLGRLSEEIAKSLADYSQEVVEKINLSSSKAGKAAVKTLRATSPKRTGKYAKSWALKTISYVNQPHKRIVYVRAPHYRLAHLLEKGHAKVGGGRVEGIPHILPVEEQVTKDFVKEVKEAIKRG